ncbi:MAG TPA: hypothetical protein VFT26_05300, partial [Pyrinomonadaceae bacterium]|nr:hypothetical protein [Pyrinomonadaceae bacterium]
GWFESLSTLNGDLLVGHLLDCLDSHREPTGRASRIVTPPTFGKSCTENSAAQRRKFRAINNQVFGDVTGTLAPQVVSGISLGED